jgi:hemolysin D
MNENVSKPQPKFVLPMQRQDKVFLPAALEILETPPSPLRLVLLLVICLLMAVALLWAYFGRVDIVASAQGKIQPIGKVKVVQSLETAKVRLINIANGSPVHAGDVLIELDDMQAKAQLAGLQSTLAAFQAEVIRRNAAIDVAHSITLEMIPNIPTPFTGVTDLPRDVIKRESRVLTGDVSGLRSQLESILGQIQQKTIEKNRYSIVVEAQGKLIETLEQRSDIRQNLLDTNVGSRADLLDTIQKVREELVTLATEQAQLASTDASLEVLRRDFFKTRDAFVAENLQKLADAEKQVDDVQQKIIEAHVNVDHAILRSPIDGLVQDLSVTTVGQVVTTGVELMRIVPQDAVLDIEAYLPNGDVGFVDVGMPATVKVEAFPFTRYGTIDGTVTRVSRDAITQQQARSTQNDATRAFDNRSEVTGEADGTTGLVFPISVRMDKNGITAGDKEVHLSPGMSVTVEIKTGKRRILEYLFSPLYEVGSKAMHER